MAKFVIGDGIDHYIESLEAIQNATTETIGRAIYAGAEIVADKVRDEIKALPVESSTKVAAAGGMMKGVSSAQKAGLLDGLGITTMQYRDGRYDVKIGFDGYNRTKTKLWPQGQPNAMIARSMESGTSFREKNPFVTRAVNSTRRAAEREMAEVFDKELAKRVSL